MNRRPALTRQSGVSLIELLIGLVIGLLVALAAMGTLAYTHTASRLVGDSTRLQQEAATAFRVIGSAVRQTGARRLEDNAGGGRVFFNPAYAGFGTDDHPFSLKGADGASNGPDTLWVVRDRGVSASETFDCLGEETPEKETQKKDEDDQAQAEKKELNVSSEFRLVAGRLSCDGSGKSQGAYGLVSGVEDFQVWYGLREDLSLHYVTATAVSNIVPPPWNQVETVRVCLRLAGELTKQPAAALTGCHGETIANDGRLPNAGERVLSDPTRFEGQKVNIATVTLAQGSEEETCTFEHTPDIGAVWVLNMITGNPASSPAFATADATMPMGNASRVRLGNGETAGIFHGSGQYLLSPCASGDPNCIARQDLRWGNIAPKRADWREMQ